jgi:hypothetical protein
MFSDLFFFWCIHVRIYHFEVTLVMLAEAKPTTPHVPSLLSLPSLSSLRLLRRFPGPSLPLLVSSGGEKGRDPFPLVDLGVYFLF